MSKPAKKTDQFDAALLVPAIVIGICYGIFLSIKGLPGGAELKAKRRAHEDAKAAAVNPAEVQRLNAERDALKDKVADKTKELDQARREGETLARKESKPQGRIDVVAQIEETLKRHGLEVTRVKAGDASNDAKMAASLQKAASSLVEALQRSRPQPANPQPQQFDPGVEEARAEAARLGLSMVNAKAPQLDLRSMEIRGDYMNMLEALWDLAESGGESVVVSLGLERPALVGKQRAPLIWRLVVHVQAGSNDAVQSRPGPTITPPRAEPERLASDKLPPR